MVCNAAICGPCATLDTESLLACSRRARVALACSAAHMSIICPYECLVAKSLIFRGCMDTHSVWYWVGRGR